MELHAGKPIVPNIGEPLAVMSPVRLAALPGLWRDWAGCGSAIVGAGQSELLPIDPTREESNEKAARRRVLSVSYCSLSSGFCLYPGCRSRPCIRAKRRNYRSRPVAQLAARAPFFHNGSAATLTDVMNFYDQRFNIGFTKQQKHDLVNFLNTL